MRYLSVMVLSLATLAITACTVDQSVCTNYCNARYNCMELEDSEANNALKRGCIAGCSVLVSEGDWSVECDEYNDDGDECESWDTDSETDPEDYKAYYQCLLERGECKGKIWQLDEDDQEECYENLD